MRKFVEIFDVTLHCIAFPALRRSGTDLFVLIISAKLKVEAINIIT